MDYRIEKVEKIFSFKPDRFASNYSLEEVNEIVKNNLINLIKKLELSSQVYLCVRGDSKRNLDSHNKFIEEELSKVFIVGEKARSNIQSSSNQAFAQYEVDPLNLRKEVEEIIKLTNNEILSKPIGHRITGTIPQSFIDNLVNLDLEQLGKWKVFFLSFLHNNGKLRDFKNYSPFVSLAYGPNKYVISRKFALQRCSFKKGILFLYSLNSGWPYYLKTIDFTNELKRFGINWYKDINCEIMLLDGMYPHHLIGIFEVEPFSNPRFIINPWLYEMLLKNETFDYEKGLIVDQTNFHVIAEKLGYRNYFFHYINDNEEFVSELNQFNHNKVYKP